MDLSSNLDWKEHIDWTVKKANSVLGFLRRNLRSNNRETKPSAYVTLVRPYLEYCASILSPHTDQSKQKLEMVQRRSARYCTNRYHNTSSVTDMLQDLNRETLESRRTKLKLVMMYKIIKNLVDIPPDAYLTPGQGWVVETIQGFNRLKPTWSICQKVVNTNLGQWLIENFKRPF